MIRPIMKDPLFLSQPSENATMKDRQTVIDLTDTLKAHTHECVGMAANMIGVRKRIIVISMGGIVMPLINPVVMHRQAPYDAEEGCLSLSGTRKTVRYRQIEVSFQDADFVPRRMTFTDWPAQIIQHEIDHCNGILI